MKSNAIFYLSKAALLVYNKDSFVMEEDYYVG